MIDPAVSPANTEDVEAALRGSLARCDAAATVVLPVLRHLVTAADGSVFSDEVLARVRGMLADLAHGLLAVMDGERGEVAGRLALALADNPAILTHVHAAAIEWQLAERLQLRLACEPVLSPQLQALITSPNGEIQTLAMAFLAAQARWCQAQQRMKLSWRELPAELLHEALLALRAAAGADHGDLARAEETVRRTYDEGASRLGLSTRLVGGLGEGGDTALSIAHAGVALFVTALALRTGQSRDAVILATHEAQPARLALALRSAGIEPGAIAEQIEAIHPGAPTPAHLDRVAPDLAANILHGTRAAESSAG